MTTATYRIFCLLASLLTTFVVAWCFSRSGFTLGTSIFVAVVAFVVTMAFLWDGARPTDH